MEDRLYYFTFFDTHTQQSEMLEIKAKTFAEATPKAFIRKSSLNRLYSKSRWDIVSVNSRNIK